MFNHFYMYTYFYSYKVLLQFLITVIKGNSRTLAFTVLVS
jgi:hypothetical protein